VNPDTLSTGMFWVGALTVLTPMLIAGVVVAVVWRGRKRSEGAGASGPRPQGE
jgi:hypothetical protein